jgi:hypothetical protein
MIARENEDVLWGLAEQLVLAYGIRSASVFPTTGPLLRAHHFDEISDAPVILIPRALDVVYQMLRLVLCTNVYTPDL